jgi:tetratricopeptide (TPR) repeat protein
MPYTVNGIGTHYYGHKNASARRGNCEFCGRLANLTSFDTRECFCVVFVPLIPMTKYRILDQCSSCRRHRRMSLADFQRDLQTRVEPLRSAVRTNRSDANAHEALVRQLIAFGLLNDAETAAREGVEAIPNSAPLNRVTGQILSMKGNLPAASAYLERAVQIDSNDAAARTSLGRAYYFQRRYDDAARQLEEVRRIAPDDLTANALLAETYFQAERWQDALAAYQRMAGSTPAKGTLRRIGDCKKKLGYELTPAERKASRRFWPFGRSKPATIKPASAGSASDVRPKTLVIVFVAAVVIAIVGGAAVGIVKSRNIDVYFDSVYPRTTFVVDGEKTLADAPPIKKTLSPGMHNVTVLDRNGKQLEQRSIDVVGHGLLESIFENRAFVFNTLGMRVYRRASITYSPNESDRDYSAEFTGGEKFFEITGIDYLFTGAPETIEMSSGTTRETKSEFTTESMSLTSYGFMRLREGKTDDAEKAFRTVLGADACDMTARRMLAQIRSVKNAADEAVKVAHDGIVQCKERPIEAHRVYQDTQQRLGHSEELTAEYRAVRDADPSSAPNHYLYGRLLDDPNAAIAEQRTALQLDPKLGWAHAALAYELLITGAYDQSMNEFARSLETEQHDESTILYYTYAAIGAKHSFDARAVVEPATREIHNESDWASKWIINLAQKNWTAAKQMFANASKGNEESASVWMAGVQLAKLSGDNDLFAKQIAFGQSKKELKIATTIAKLQDAMENGKWSDAAANESDLHENAYMMHLYGVAALMLNGDTKGANDRLNVVLQMIRTDKELDQYSRDVYTNLASAMTGGDETKILRAVREDVTMIKNAYFFLGVHSFAHGDRAHAKQLFAKSAETSFDLDFPLLAAQRLASGAA